MNHITPVFFDKLGFTFPVPDSKKKMVQSNLYRVSRNPYYNSRFYKTTNDKRYGNHYIFHIPTDNHAGKFTAEVDIYPINKSHNFIRFVFNPSKFGSSGKTELYDLIKSILGPKATRKVYKHSRLTRLDITIDSHRKHDGSYMYMKRAQVSEIIRPVDDEIQSQIIGSPSSDIRAILYDKASEFAKNGITIDQKACSRLEIQICDLGYSISDIPKALKNPFKKLSFFSDEFLQDEYFEENFLSNTYDNGLNDALHRLDKNTRKRYLRRLKHYKCEPYQLQALSKPDMKVLQFLRHG